MAHQYRLVLLSQDAELGNFLSRAFAARQRKLFWARGRTELFHFMDEKRADVFILDAACSSDSDLVERELGFLREHFLAEQRPHKTVVLSQAHPMLGRESFSEEVIVFPKMGSLGLLEDFVQKSLTPDWPSGEVVYYLDPVRMTVVFSNGKSTSLTPTEYQLMALFDQTPDSRVSRQFVIEAIWGARRVCSKTLNVHFNHLRRKLRLGGIDVRYCGRNFFCLEKLRKPINRPSNEVSAPAIHC